MRDRRALGVDRLYRRDILARSGQNGSEGLASLDPAVGRQEQVGEIGPRHALAAAQHDQGGAVGLADRAVGPDHHQGAGGGVEDAVVASLGPVVACAAHGKYLAIAYHGGIPDGEGRQHVQVQVLDVESRQTLNGNGTRLPLQPGCLLTWLAFKSDDGVLLASDSQGSFWLLVDDFGHRWAPALDAATTRHNIGDREWPVYAKHGSVHCCVLKGGLTQPQCRGARPVLDALPLRLPHASSARDAAQRRAEAGLGAPTTLARQRARLAGAAGVLAFTRRPASDDAAKHERISRDLARAANEAILQRDRAVLRQLVAATKDGAYARAYDLARRLQLRESLDLARRIAASHGEDALTARVEDLIAVADGTTGDEDAMDEENVAPEAPKEES